MESQRDLVSRVVPPSRSLVSRLSSLVLHLELGYLHKNAITFHWNPRSHTNSQWNHLSILNARHRKPISPQLLLPLREISHPCCRCCEKEHTRVQHISRFLSRCVAVWRILSFRKQRGVNLEQALSHAALIMRQGRESEATEVGFFL